MTKKRKKQNTEWLSGFYDPSKIDNWDEFKSTWSMGAHAEDKMSEEIWRKCHPSNKYEVSNIGRVRFRKNKKIMNQHETDRGYLKVQFYLPDNKKEMPFVHRLVLTAFCGGCPKGFQAGHLNGNKHDNRIENLKWITPRENTRHKYIHGVVAQRGKDISFKVNRSAGS